MSNRLIRWNTGRLINRELYHLKFFSNYEMINKDLFDMYKHIEKYAYDNYNGRASIRHNEELYDSLVQHLDNMIDFQNLVDSQDPSINLAEEAKSRFDNKHVRSTEALERQEIKRLNLLLEYSESVRNLFNDSLSLTNYHEKMSTGLISEIEEVLLNKGLDNFDIPDELLINNQIKVDQEV